MKNLCNGYDLHIAHGLLSVRTRTYLILRSTWRYYSEVAKFDREILISINFPLDSQVISNKFEKKKGRKKGNTDWKCTIHEHFISDISISFDPASSILSRKHQRNSLCTSIIPHNNPR